MGGRTNGSDTHPLMPRVTPLFARFSRGLVAGAFNLKLHLAAGDAPFVLLSLLLRKHRRFNLTSQVCWSTDKLSIDSKTSHYFLYCLGLYVPVINNSVNVLSL